MNRDDFRGNCLCGCHELNSIVGLITMHFLVLGVHLLSCNVDQIKNIHQFENPRTAKKEWKKIDRWVKKPESLPGLWSYKKIEVREKNRSVKFRKIENNKDIAVIDSSVDRDSDESEIDDPLDSLRPVEILFLHSCSAALSFISLLNSPSHSSVRILFRPLHFARVAVISFKENWATENISAFGALRA